MTRNRQLERPPTWRPTPDRRGVSLPEVVVVVAILTLLVLVAMVALPRQRETARTAGCRRNLMQIGVALALYDRSEGTLPAIPALSATPEPGGGPLRALLDALALPDLVGLNDPEKPPERRPGQVPGERPVTGFVCPSGTFPASTAAFPAPVSYRATAGDGPTGHNGVFAPGRTSRLSDVAVGDGLAYTAAFSERLPGNGAAYPGGVNYRRVPGPLGNAGCPPAPVGAWRGDAGTSWAEASWRSTLYNHALTPNAAPSCVADNGATAFVGASSGHTGGVNVLSFAGSVRTVSPTVAPPVWKALATTRSDAGSPPQPRPQETR